MPSLTGGRPITRRRRRAVGRRGLSGQGHRARQPAGVRMTDPLEIRLLGPFEVEAGGRPAEVSGSKRRGLLALLALRSGRVVDVEELIDVLWGEDLPAAPRNAVQHHVARLRAALGPESIIASADGYALHGASVDALRFEELLREARFALREGDIRAGADSVVTRARAVARSAAARPY